MSARGNNFDSATRAQVVALRVQAQLTAAQVTALTGVGDRGQRSIVQRARERGFDGKQLLLEHVADKPRSGRPAERTEDKTDKVLQFVRRSKATRSYSCQQIANAVGGLSRELVPRILHAAGMHKVKRSTKLGLSEEQRARRLKWCLDHKDTDWKRVCFSDETSVVLGARRGNNRVWRLPSEAFDPTCMKRRWKGAKSLMFWGCFSYHFKGPCYIWEAETAAERKQSEQQLAALNKAREPALRESWELTTGLQRVKLRKGRTPGRPPKWRFTEKNGKLVRRGKGGEGIDWWRYRTKVLEPLLLPFCRQHNLVVQEDGAPAHIHHLNRKLVAE